MAATGHPALGRKVYRPPTEAPEGHRHEHLYCTANTSQPLPTTRRELRRHLRGQPAKIRAKVAADIVTGSWPYKMSIAEAADAVGTHPRCVHAALGRNKKTLTDAEIDHLIARVGPDRLMAGLDRLTSPLFNF
jgi:hypothetical protein